MTTTASEDFKAEIDEFIAVSEAWLDAIGYRPGLKHIEQLKRHIAAATEIEQRVVDAGPEHAAQLKRAFNVRSNLGALLSVAEGRLVNFAGMNAAVAAINAALEPLSDDEKRGVLTVAMANVAVTPPPGDEYETGLPN